MLSLGGLGFRSWRIAAKVNRPQEDSGSSLGVDIAFAQPYDGRVAGKVEGVTMESWVPRGPVI